MNAIETFNPEEGPFHPYAARLVRQAIKDGIIYSGQDIRRARWQYNLYGKIERFQSLFLRTHGISPSIEEIAKGIEVAVPKVRDCLVAKAGSRVVSETVATNAKSGEAFTVDPCFPGPTPLERLLAKENTCTEEALHARYLATLRDLRISDRDREIFERRLCLNGYPPYRHVDEIAGLFGLSASSIRSITSRVAHKLGFALEGWGSDDWLRMSHADADVPERASA